MLSFETIYDENNPKLRPNMVHIQLSSDDAPIKSQREFAVAFKKSNSEGGEVGEALTAANHLISVTVSSGDTDTAVRITITDVDK